MSGFLTDLVRRQEKPADAVRPRLPSLFETDAGPTLPHPKSDAPISEVTVEEAAPAAEETTRASRPLAQSARQMPAAPAAQSDAPDPAFAPSRQRAAPLQPLQPLGQNVEREAQPAAVQPRRAPRIEDEPAEAPVAAEAPAFAIQPVAERRLTRLSPVIEETEIVEAPRMTTTRTVTGPTATQEQAPAPAIRPVPRPPVFEQKQAAVSPFAMPPPQTRQQTREAQRRQHEQPQVPAEPSIHVTIGRIEIRASEEREPRARAKDAPSSVMTLDEYLKSRAKR
jgi:hypothetical protein